MMTLEPPSGPVTSSIEAGVIEVGRARPSDQELADRSEAIGILLTLLVLDDDPLAR